MHNHLNFHARFSVTWSTALSSLIGVLVLHARIQVIPQPMAWGSRWGPLSLAVIGHTLYTLVILDLDCISPDQDTQRWSSSVLSVINQPPTSIAPIVPIVQRPQARHWRYRDATRDLINWLEHRLQDSRPSRCDAWLTVQHKALPRTELN